MDGISCFWPRKPLQNSTLFWMKLTVRFTLTCIAAIVYSYQANNAGPAHALIDVPFDLGRFPALRHLKIQRQSLYGDKLTPVRFLTPLLSISSSSNGIEVLEIGIVWHTIQDEHGKDLFASDAGWSTFDQLIASQTFGSLKKVVLRLDLWMERFIGLQRDFDNDPQQQHILELERNLILPYVNDLFPLFRADPQRILESRFKVARPCNVSY
jgi:hypothetical protein